MIHIHIYVSTNEAPAYKMMGIFNSNPKLNDISIS